MVGFWTYLLNLSLHSKWETKKIAKLTYTHTHAPVSEPDGAGVSYDQVKVEESSLKLRVFGVERIGEESISQSRGDLGSRVRSEN